MSSYNCAIVIIVVDASMIDRETKTSLLFVHEIATIVSRDGPMGRVLVPRLECRATKLGAGLFILPLSFPFQLRNNVQEVHLYILYKS